MRFDGTASGVGTTFRKNLGLEEWYCEIKCNADREPFVLHVGPSLGFGVWEEHVCNCQLIRRLWSISLCCCPQLTDACPLLPIKVIPTLFVHPIALSLSAWHKVVMSRNILRATEVAVLHLLTSYLAREFNLSVRITALLPSENCDFVFQFTSKRTLRNDVCIVITLWSSCACLVWWRLLNRF